jgi:queuine tRNA-ribosyltransferase
MLLSWANTWFYQDLMARMRDAIARGRFAEFREKIRAIYPPSAEKSPV